MKRTALALLLVIAALPLPVRASGGRALLVCGPCPEGTGAHFTSARDAAAAAEPGDWIMIWPGTYRESVVVRTDDVHVRGMDRNRVIFDGEDARANGITAIDVTNSWIENVSTRRFTNNGIFWTSVFGYWGRYLTATGSHYGIYPLFSTADPANKAIIADSYAAGNDGGFYVGGCTPCHAILVNVLAENNAIGFVGTNAGGDLSIVYSEWRDNYSGIVPNTLSSEPYLPQRDMLIYGNYVHDNNNARAWGADVESIAPLGTGIAVAGGWANVIEGNRIENHKHYGVLMAFLQGGSMFNVTVRNRLANNGDADLANDATSAGNCFEENVGAGGGEPTSDPPMIQTLYSCGLKGAPGLYGLGYPTGPGSPVVTALTALNMAGITEPRDPQHWDAPQQTTMPNPCEGAPDSSWCSSGSLVVSV